MGGIQVTSIDSISGNMRTTRENIALTVSEEENLQLEKGFCVKFVDPVYGRVTVQPATSNHHQLKDRRYIQQLLVPSRNYASDGIFIRIDTSVPQEASKTGKVSLNGSYPSLDFVVEREQLYGAQSRMNH